MVIDCPLSFHPLGEALERQKIELFQHEDSYPYMVETPSLFPPLPQKVVSIDVGPKQMSLLHKKNPRL